VDAVDSTTVTAAYGAVGSSSGRKGSTGTR
jgi:hypothetical protein